MNGHLTRLLYTLLPGTCLLCKAPSHRLLDLCEPCEKDLPGLDPACWQCGLRADQDICLACRQNPPNWSHCFSAFSYEPPVNLLISQFKGEGKLLVGKVLTQVLGVRYAKAHLFYPDILIPVPLHPTRLKSRGFNQAAEVARWLAGLLTIECRTSACQRVRETGDQKTLDKAARAGNMLGAFTVLERVAGKKVGLVDDVVTTGATVAELSRNLAEAGASDVQVICLARTPAK